ncbi:MAG: hypothetical protein HY332_06770 [Chloroflexi bacterium]|nr:hypothetical protein [Chloroflexota bacterium]
MVRRFERFPEQLELGPVGEGGGVDIGVLGRLGVDPQVARSRTLQAMAAGPATGATGATDGEAGDGD